MAIETELAPATTPQASWKVVLRWIAVFPGAVLGMVATGLVMQVINWLTSSRFGDDTWFTYIWQNGAKSAAEGAAFVWAGAYIAPRGEKITAIVLAGLILFVSGASFLIGWSNREWMNLWQIVATNIGAIVAAVSAQKNGIR